MPDITAKAVNELRAKTGQGMMECKKVLTEAGGDIEKAIEIFPQEGREVELGGAATLPRAASLARRNASSAALVELNCNTDFTAKSEPLLKLGNDAAHALLKNPTAMFPPTRLSPRA